MVLAASGFIMASYLLFKQSGLMLLLISMLIVAIIVKIMLKGLHTEKPPYVIIYENGIEIPNNICRPINKSNLVFFNFREIADVIEGGVISDHVILLTNGEKKRFRTHPFDKKLTVETIIDQWNIKKNS